MRGRGRRLRWTIVPSIISMRDGGRRLCVVVWVCGFCALGLNLFGCRRFFRFMGRGYKVTERDFLSFVSFRCALPGVPSRRSDFGCAGQIPLCRRCICWQTACSRSWLDVRVGVAHNLLTTSTLPHLHVSPKKADGVLRPRGPRCFIPPFSSPCAWHCVS